ncbi:Crp/Fnr family transcriptional regulator [Rubinisphaera italica]|uniref:Global nitrogen regulator n=1 Tax=Rubinisphaera italica TaxID=2527969 RepID=A0A5C5XNF9_9PLAN|nr:Crp/Fnr family transcriptional regulator [Rubinisphaera italica]TWT64021.1 Global nitrogen regulator [Rubinisphaera italica]
MSQQLWYVRDCSLFRRLSEEQLIRLERRARIREFPRNSVIYLPSDEADGAFLLGRGRVRICSNTAEGKQSILAFIDPGELFGELSLVQGGEREERAEAAMDSTVILLPGEELRQIMEESAMLSLGVTKLIGLRRKRIERRLRNLLFRSNRDRIGHLLLELTEQYGKVVEDGVHLNIKLSHQEMASIIGVTRETVTTLLGELQLEGLVKVSRQKVIIRNLRRLASILDVAVPSLAVGAETRSIPKPFTSRPLPSQGGVDS